MEKTMETMPVQHHEEKHDLQAQGELSPEELAREQGADLPDREAMSLINANLAAPVNAAVAANVLSDDSIAYAEANQYAPINQSQ